MISILRGSFDIILPCVLDAAGRCKLPPQMSGDMEKLEKMLGSRVAGANLKDFLAGEDAENPKKNVFSSDNFCNLGFGHVFLGLIGTTHSE